MTQNPFFDKLFEDHRDICPIIAILDETACPASLARAKQVWWGHGEARLESLSEYLHYALTSLLGFHDDRIIWGDMAYFYVEFGNEQKAREAFIEAKLSEDCVRGAYRFTNRDHGAILHQYRRMDGLIQLNESIDLLDGSAMNYCSELENENGANTRLPDFGCIERLRESLKAEVELFETELGALLKGMTLCGC